MTNNLSKADLSNLTSRPKNLYEEENPDKIEGLGNQKREHMQSSSAKADQLLQGVQEHNAAT